MYKYFRDDTKALGDLLAKNWKLTKPSTTLYYEEESDPNTHNFGETLVAVFIMEADAEGEKGGIAFDHLENLKKNMYIYVSSLSRDNTAKVVNEVMRILVENRLYSINEWDIIAVLESKRIVPAYRFFQWVIKVQLTDIIVPYPNSGKCIGNIIKKKE